MSATYHFLEKLQRNLSGDWEEVLDLQHWISVSQKINGTQLNQTSNGQMRAAEDPKEKAFLV